MAGRRTSFTRLRPGSSDATISPAWITSYAPPGGMPQAITRNEILRLITASIIVVRGADVALDDVLINANGAQRYVVLQINQGPVTNQLLVGEFDLAVTSL